MTLRNYEGLHPLPFLPDLPMQLSNVAPWDVLPLCRAIDNL